MSSSDVEALIESDEQSQLIQIRDPKQLRDLSINSLVEGYGAFKEITKVSKDTKFVDVIGSIDELEDASIEKAACGGKAVALLAAKTFIAGVVGASSVYATFGPIAMLYHEGLWLLLPVSTGAIICMTGEVVEGLSKKYPDSGFLKNMNTVMQYSSKGIVGFFASYGFSWGMFKSLGILAGGLEYAQNDYAKITSPILAVIPGILSTFVRYKDSTKQAIDRGWLRHVAQTLRGAVSSSFINQFILQGLLPADSPIPITLILVGGIMGLISSLAQESFPLASLVLVGLIAILGENVSLAMNEFSFPNDIFASLNDWMVPEWFFYSNMAQAVVFWVVLTSLAGAALVAKRRGDGRDSLQADDYTNHLESSSSSDSYDSLFSSSGADEEDDTIIDMLNWEQSEITDVDRINRLGLIPSITSGIKTQRERGQLDYLNLDGYSPV